MSQSVNKGKMKQSDILQFNDWHRAFQRDLHSNTAVHNIDTIIDGIFASLFSQLHRHTLT